MDNEDGELPVRSPATAGKALLTILVLFLSSTFLLGGTCSWSFCTNCDDDDGDLDDEDERVTIGANESDTGPADDLRLRDYVLQVATDPGAHPTRRVLEIQGLSLSRVFGPGAFGQEELFQFTDLVLAGNTDLIGLPVEAGILVRDRVVFRPNGVLVLYTQQIFEGQQDFEGPNPRLLENAHLLFHLDPFGSLVEIDNLTYLAPPGS